MTTLSKFNVLTPQQVLASYNGGIKSEFPTAKPSIRKSLFSILGRGFSLIIHGNYIWLENLSDVPFVALCPVEFVPLHGTQEGLAQKPALGATGDVLATGVNGSAISVGDRLVTVDGSNLQYEAVEAGVIAGGAFIFEVRSLNFGLDTNQGAGVNLEFVTPPAGVDTSATVEAGGLINGADLEDIELYRQRILFKKRNPFQCGAPTDYIQWALMVPEVTRAFVFPIEDGLGTVRVRFMMDNKFVDGIPLPADEVVVKDFIETLNPAQVGLFVSAPIAQPLVVDVSLTPNTLEVQAAVTAAIEDLIIREAEPGGSILLSKIRQAVSNATGESDNVVNSPAADVTTPDDATIITFATPTFS